MQAETLAEKILDLAYDTNTYADALTALLHYAEALIQAREALAGAREVLRKSTPALTFAALHGMTCTPEESERGGRQVDAVDTALARLDALLEEPRG